VNCRLEPLSEITADPLSLMHRICFPGDPWNSEAMAEIMSITGFFGRIAWVDEMPAGFALALDLRKECEILSLGVVPGWRRKGIGSTLLDAICSEGLVRGAKYIVLEVAIDNNAALALYTDRGFMPVGRRQNYYRQAGRRIDALVLRRALSDVNDPAMSW
jgi:[ribosomal protein S18]-alanine N-acetyltransferase